MTAIATTTTASQLRPGALVQWNLNATPVTAEVCAPEVLDNLTVENDLVDAGWQLAELHGTHGRVLIRPTGQWATIRKWNGAQAARIEVASIETYVIQHPTGPIIVAGVGERLDVKAVTLADNLIESS